MPSIRVTGTVFRRSLPEFYVTVGRDVAGPGVLSHRTVWLAAVLLESP